jgi:hypothetical protein
MPRGANAFQSSCMRIHIPPNRPVGTVAADRSLSLIADRSSGSRSHGCQELPQRSEQGQLVLREHASEFPKAAFAGFHIFVLRLSRLSPPPKPPPPLSPPLSPCRRARVCVDRDTLQPSSSLPHPTDFRPALRPNARNRRSSRACPRVHVQGAVRTLG